MDAIDRRMLALYWAAVAFLFGLCGGIVMVAAIDAQVARYCDSVGKYMMIGMDGKRTCFKTAEHY